MNISFAGGCPPPTACLVSGQFCPPSYWGSTVPALVPWAALTVDREWQAPPASWPSPASQGAWSSFKNRAALRASDGDLGSNTNLLVNLSHVTSPCTYSLPLPSTILMKIKKDTMDVDNFMCISDYPSQGLGAKAELSKNLYPHNNLPFSGSML